MKKLIERPGNPQTEDIFFLKNYIRNLEEYCTELEQQIKIISHQYDMARHELSYYGLLNY